RVEDEPGTAVVATLLAARGAAERHAVVRGVHREDEHRLVAGIRRDDVERTGAAARADLQLHAAASAALEDHRFDGAADRGVRVLVAPGAGSPPTRGGERERLRRRCSTGRGDVELRARGAGIPAEG